MTNIGAYCVLAPVLLDQPTDTDEAIGQRDDTMTAIRRGSGLRRFARRFFKTLVVLAVVGGAVYALGEWYKTHDYLPHFLERKTDLIGLPPV